MPLITVMIPCRNGEPFIGPAVRSVLDQEGVDVELIVVDDGSTDTSRQTVLGMNDPRVRVIDGPRAGVAAVTNAAIPHIRGDYFTRCDADDLYTPGRLAEQLRALQERPDFDAVCGRFEMMSHDGEHLSTVGGGDVAMDVTDELAGGVTRTHWNAWMFRSDAFRAVGGCRTYFKVGEDIDVMLRFPPKHRVWYEPKVWYRYRLHEGSTVHTIADNRRAFLEAQAKLFLKQRLATGTDDLEQGKAAPLPEVGNSRLFYAGDQIQSILIGRAWSEHRAGKKKQAIRTGWRAVKERPRKLSAWKTLLMLMVK